MEVHIRRGINRTKLM